MELLTSPPYKRVPTNTVFEDGSSPTSVQSTRLFTTVSEIWTWSVPTHFLHLCPQRQLAPNLQSAAELNLRQYTGLPGFCFWVWSNLLAAGLPPTQRCILPIQCQHFYFVNSWTDNHIAPSNQEVMGSPQKKKQRQFQHFLRRKLTRKSYIVQD